MANVIVNEDYLKATANAIRAKNGKTSTYTPSDFANAISSLGGGAIIYNMP